MPYLIVIGLLIVLGVLLVARSAQQETRPFGVQHPPAPSPTPVPAEATRPISTRDAGRLRDRRRAGSGFDSYLWDSRRIAHRHESRADSLDFFGMLTSILAGLVALGGVVGVGSAGELDRDEKVLVAVSTSMGVLGLIAAAAVFFGFGAVVRNTSRSLAISAGVALDSYDPPDDEPAGHGTGAPARIEHPNHAPPSQAPEHSPDRPVATDSPWMPPDS